MSTLLIIAAERKNPRGLPQNQAKSLKDRILFHLPPVREEKSYRFQVTSLVTSPVL